MVIRRTRHFRARRKIATAMVALTLGLLLGIVVATRWSVAWIGRRAEVAVINGSMIIGVPTMWTPEGFLPNSGLEIRRRSGIRWDWWRWQFHRFQATPQGGARSELVIGFPLWVLPVATLVVALISFRSSRVAAGICPQCGYSLGGLRPNAACPECGQLPRQQAALSTER